MAKVVVDMSMSLDGFVPGPNDEAGDGIVGVGGASTAQQCLNAGLVDAVRVSLVPYLLGEGVPIFAGLATPVVRAPGRRPRPGVHPLSGA
jgi:dihydrofolate reductase